MLDKFSTLKGLLAGNILMLSEGQIGVDNVFQLKDGTSPPPPIQH